MILVVLLLPTVATALCPDTDTCISRVREVVAASRRFWFGEQRRSLCQNRNADPVECIAPPHLSAFHSVGSRLFRVRTYHAAYLRNLQIFPKVTYKAHSGEYRACDHNFRAGNGSVQVIECDPDMTLVAPYFIRSKPEFSWDGLQYNEQFIIAIVDVGFGSLNYLVSGFPSIPKVLHEYEPSENFRPNPNPMAVLVFRQSKPTLLKTGRSVDFDTSKFMLENELADDLIGLSLIIVGSDAFAIEQQRLRGTIDNCHSLLKSKLLQNPLSAKLGRMPLDELNSWLTVSVEQPQLDVSLCCQQVRQKSDTIYFDPLGAATVSALVLLKPPLVNSARIHVESPSFVNYHRQARTHFAPLDELYTVVAIDANTSTLHWMIVDIFAQQLALHPNGITKASYVSFAPKSPGICSPFALLLFSQPSTLAIIPDYCDTLCKQRENFQVDVFKQQYNLRLRAISWMNICYDMPYAYHVITHITNSSSLSSFKSDKSPSPLPYSSTICSAFHISNHLSCPVSSTADFSDHLLAILLLLFLFVRNN